VSLLTAETAPPNLRAAKALGAALGLTLAIQCYRSVAGRVQIGFPVTVRNGNSTVSTGPTWRYT